MQGRDGLVGDLKTLRIAFCGNRFFVLEDMLGAKLGLVSIAAVSGSHLERTLVARDIAHTPVRKKADFLAWLDAGSFDLFVSNGCPFIVPADRLGDDRLFVNVHPSFLPDLRGADPVPGALFSGRDAGATCHVIDAGVDTGDIISQVSIPFSGDLDAGLLYQLSFMAEKEVFRTAMDRNFRPALGQSAHADLLTYTRSESDLRIDWNQSAVQIVRRVRAFSNRSQGARFSVGGTLYRCFDAEVVDNAFLVERKDRFADRHIALCYEGTVLVRTGDVFVKLKSVDGDLSRLHAGEALEQEP
jgi:methionyl-tRNA formyltransferase